MNRITLSGLFLGLTLSAIIPLAQAEHTRHGHADYARVISAKPIYESIRYSEPYDECRYEERVTHHHSASATILGSIIGGAIGNELGHNKSNKQVGMVAGALLGGAIGHDIDRRKPRRHHVYTEKVCSTYYREGYLDELVGYKVKYKYRGVVYHTRTAEHPGKRIKVNVDVRPAI